MGLSSGTEQWLSRPVTLTSLPAWLAGLMLQGGHRRLRRAGYGGSACSLDAACQRPAAQGGQAHSSAGGSPLCCLPQLHTAGSLVPPSPSIGESPLHPFMQVAPIIERGFSKELEPSAAEGALLPELQQPLLAEEAPTPVPPTPGAERAGLSKALAIIRLGLAGRRCCWLFPC